MRPQLHLRDVSPIGRKPATIEERIEAIEYNSGKIAETLNLLQKAVGEEPNAVTGEKGSGLMLFAVELLEERRLHRKRMETAMKIGSTFGGFAAAIGATVGILKALGAF